MDNKFLKPYDPAATETAIYQRWEDSGYFNPDNLPGERTNVFSMVLPPPNVTGTLHMGSALMLAIEDIMIRYKRMRGYAVLWLPGTDSAAIATQARVEKDLQKAEGKSRHDLGRDELLKRIEVFVEANKSAILSQFRAMGASLDWSRYAYTMDEKRYAAVMEAFIRMHAAGLIYRGNRIVNWDPKGQTTISDDEIVHEERDAKLYTLKYSKDFPIAISTTRPETKVGDVAVAVHPDDERYKKFVGKEYDAVFCDVPIHIQVIADKEVDRDFGTGALGVTPAHSMIDWEIADRHNLPRPQVINEYAKMTVAGRLNGKKVAEAREAIVEWLKSERLLEKEEDVKQNIATAERTGGIVEPLPKLQWWVNVNKEFTLPHSEIPGITSGSQTTLKEIMRKAVESGATKFVTERFERIYFNWIDNLRDWCISRQIWFGHRIPVWYRPTDAHGKQEMKVSVQSPGAGWEQDPDVLDTWFSAGLWTFSTMGWPDKTSDLARFHPTTVIETGYDIIFFWVARMILMSGFLTGQVPFRTIYLHGLVRDGQGRKISKSLGNNIDPVTMGVKYGTDAVRVALVAGMAPAQDSRVSEDKIRTYKIFANKLWNIARFVLDAAEKTQGPTSGRPLEVGPVTQELDALVTDVTRELDNFHYHLAAEKLYHYVWDRFASEIIEESKPTLVAGGEAAASRAHTLYAILDTVLRLLHPFMPFVTEEIWQSLPDRETDLLMVAPWPALSGVEGPR
jgi:valyl-tRNA synthetase